ncbi:MAG: hypothetical protein HOV83_05495 [Catenulispora sp.]|nr:hypothetical protein [Catenulispora sp.]
MANPEMSSAQEQSLGAVPPQAMLADVGNPAGEPPEAYELSAAGTGEGLRSTSRAPSAAHPESAGRTLPLIARVLLADLGLAILALIALTFIEVQRMGEASLHLRRQAYAEDLVVLFVVAAVFGVVTFLLFRAGRLKVAIVQAVVTALVLGVAITSAATGNPKPVTVEQEQEQ